MGQQEEGFFWRNLCQTSDCSILLQITFSLFITSRKFCAVTFYIEITQYHVWYSNIMLAHHTHHSNANIPLSQPTPPPFQLTSSHPCFWEPQFSFQTLRRALIFRVCLVPLFSSIFHTGMYLNWYLYISWIILLGITPQAWFYLFYYLNSIPCPWTPQIFYFSTHLLLNIWIVSRSYLL